MAKPTRLFKPGDMVRIKEGAVVWQRNPEPRWFIWPDIESNEDTIFCLEKYERRDFAKLYAPKYGLIAPIPPYESALYGNGPIITRDKYLEKVD